MHYYLAAFRNEDNEIETWSKTWGTPQLALEEGELNLLYTFGSGSKKYKERLSGLSTIKCEISQAY